MIERTTPGAPVVATSAPSPAAPAEAVARKKKTLLDQVLVVESAAERLDLSLRGLADRGETSEMMSHERDCLKATAQTLMLLMEHERDVVDLVKRKREYRTAGRSRR